MSHTATQSTYACAARSTGTMEREQAQTTSSPEGAVSRVDGATGDWHTGDGLGSTSGAALWTGGGGTLVALAVGVPRGF